MRATGLLVAASVIAVLTACGPAPQDAPPPAPVVAAPPAPMDVTDFTRPLNLLGNEPFWSVRIRSDGLTYSAPDTADVAVPNAGPEVSGIQAVWASGPMKVTVEAEVCQDGMSGLNYPFAATVEIEGRTLTGCAAYADAMPREGG
jgi:uncharacterized membrane protein